MLVLEQHYLTCLSQASYLVGDTDAGVAAVVDPRRDVGVYLEAAERLGVKIEHVLLTHFHADFLAEGRGSGDGLAGEEGRGFFRGVFK